MKADNINTFLDIMVGDHFVCQIKYTKRGFPVILEDGRMAEIALEEDMEKFAEEWLTENRPSIKNKDYYVKYSNQKR